MPKHWVERLYLKLYASPPIQRLILSKFYFVDFGTLGGFKVLLQEVVFFVFVFVFHHLFFPAFLTEHCSHHISQLKCLFLPLWHFIHYMSDVSTPENFQKQGLYHPGFLATSSREVQDAGIEHSQYWEMKLTAQCYLIQLLQDFQIDLIIRNFQS